MSGASGKVLAAIHVVPEAADAGPIARLRDGDTVRIDADAGVLETRMDGAAWDARPPTLPDAAAYRQGTGRELFGLMRSRVSPAERGASSLFVDEDAGVASA
jgi:phosphogluconate dehydratase